MFDIDIVRKSYLAFAEALDAFRVVPRILLVAYGYLVYFTVDWFVKLEPYMLEGCKVEDMSQCIVQAPTTQHAALVSVVVGAAAVVIGLYQNSGRKWNGFTPWKKELTDSKEE